MMCEENQVAPFHIMTKDKERLFAWLIAPLGVYSKNATDFIAEKSRIDDIEARLAFKLLREDADARLLLYFHGNTGTVAQGRRTEEYRMYGSGASDKIFVITFDYRGFGKSTGSPSESGLLKDAEAVVDWALNTAGISPDRIVLLGHSLGTAVATGIVHHYATRDEPIVFAGLILCAAFTNTANGFAAYSIADVVPVLAPVKLISPLHSWFSRRFKDTWRTDERLAALVKRCEEFQLVLVHAQDDGTMPWDQTEELFASTLRAAIEVAQPELRIVDMGEAGTQEIWRLGRKSVSKLIARHGGENYSRTVMHGNETDYDDNRPQHHDEVVAGRACRAGVIRARACHERLGA